jgi:hypothetical protein
LELNQKNKNDRKNYTKQYYLLHKEKFKARQKQYYKDHHEQYKKYLGNNLK